MATTASTEAELRSLAESLAETIKAEKELETEKRRIKDRMAALMREANLEKTKFSDGLSISMYTAKNPSTLSKELLLQAGVTVDVIAACTIPGADRIEIKVTLPKEK